MSKKAMKAFVENDVGVQNREALNYVLSPLEEDILTVLSIQEAYGFLISKAIEKASNGTRKIAVGSLYPSLRRLEQKGLVKSWWDTSEENPRAGARRRYYEITPSGRKVLLKNREIRENLLRWQTGEPIFAGN